MTEPAGKFTRPLQAPLTSRGEARRQALIDAASELFLEGGYDGVSLEDLVAHCGGSKTSIYQYFGGKEGLFYEVIAIRGDRFFSELRIPDHADEDLAGTLRDIGRQYLSMDLVPKQREWFRMLMSVLPRFPELAQRFYSNSARDSIGPLANYLRLQCAAGRLRSEDPELLAAHFLELLSCRSNMRVLLGLQPFAPEQPVDSHVAAVVDLLLNGCGIGPSSRGRD